MLECDYKLLDGTITKSFLPPQHFFQIEKDNKIVHFTAFADLFNDDTILLTTKHIRILIQQREHILSLHDKVSHICSIIEKFKVSNKGKEKATASIQPPSEINDFKLSKLGNIERWLEGKYKKDLELNPLHVIDDSRNNIPTKINIPDEIKKISEKHARKPPHRKKKHLDKHEKRKSERKISKYDKSNACYKCGRIRHYARDCKVKDKIKSLNLDENIKDTLCKILLNLSSEGSSHDNSENEESHTSEDLRALHNEDYIPSSEEECLPCQIGQPCEDKEMFEIHFQNL
uniref:CCHC-type domain-containing protein n=1 Tax=Solanum lycopersicum TaxID=4081 RepID=A0A3Q7IE97_SOLLC